MPRELLIDPEIPVFLKGHVFATKTCRQYILLSSHSYRQENQRIGEKNIKTSEFIRKIPKKHRETESEQRAGNKGYGDWKSHPRIPYSLTPRNSIPA